MEIFMDPEVDLLIFDGFLWLVHDMASHPINVSTTPLGPGEI